MNDLKRNTPGSQKSEKSNVKDKQLSRGNSLATNSQQFAIYKTVNNLQSILKYAHTCKADEFKRMLYHCYCFIGKAFDTNVEVPDNYNLYLSAIKDKRDEMIELFVLLVNQRTSFGDSIWFFLSEDMSARSAISYDLLFVSQLQYGRTTINDSFGVRKSFRYGMIKDIREKPMLEPPEYKSITDGRVHLYTLDEVTQEQVEPDFLSSLSSSKEQTNPNAILNSHTQFCNYFIKYINSPDRQWSEVEFLIEELMQCFYFQLDQTAMNPFTSLQGTKTDRSIHRAVRYFMVNCPIFHLSKFILELGKSDPKLNKLIRLNLNHDDRCYLDDSQMMLGDDGKIKYRCLVEFNPFSMEFGEGVRRGNYQTEYGLFEIPADEDATDGNVEDELAKLINQDIHFRPITKRQLTDWCPMGSGYDNNFPCGKWNATYEIELLSKYNSFNQAKGQILKEIYEIDAKIVKFDDGQDGNLLVRFI